MTRGDFDKADRETVKAMRGRGASWSAVARALGRSEPTVRAYFDPTYPGHRVSETEAKTVFRAPLEWELSVNMELALGLLMARPYVVEDAIVAATSWSPTSLPSRMSSLRTMLSAHGVTILRVRMEGYRLDPDSKAIVRRALASEVAGG